MSVLTKFLEAKNPAFGLALRQLELITGKKGEDVKLIAEIIKKVHQHMVLLKLDPNDTTGPELYYALLNRVKEDNIRIAKKLGGKNPDSLSEMLPLIINKVKQFDIPKTCWALKDSVALNLLINMPPKNVMKRLRYRKVESMLANEDLYEVYNAMRFAEKPDWLNDFIKQYKKLRPVDFEEREIKIASYDSKKWGNIAEYFIKKKLHNITHLKELGVIMAMPVDLKTTIMTGKGIVLKVLPLLLHYVNEVRLYSAFFKLMRARHNFGDIIVDTLIADTPNKSVRSDKWVDWRVIQRYFGKLKSESHPEMFEPHVHPEDLHWRKAEDTLYKFDPAMEFWRGMDYVAHSENQDIITFNLMDMALSYANGLPYGQHYIYHFRESLWNEVFMRYMGKEVLKQKILEQLNNEMIQPEKVKPS